MMARSLDEQMPDSFEHAGRLVTRLLAFNEGFIDAIPSGFGASLARFRTTLHAVETLAGSYSRRDADRYAE
jgi:hypothetical protein